MTEFWLEEVAMNWNKTLQRSNFIFQPLLFCDSVINFFFAKQLSIWEQEKEVKEADLQRENNLPCFPCF